MKPLNRILAAYYAACKADQDLTDAIHRQFGLHKDRYQVDFIDYNDETLEAYQRKIDADERYSKLCESHPLICERGLHATTRRLMSEQYPVAYLEGQILSLLRTESLSTAEIINSIVQIEGLLPKKSTVRNALYRLEHSGYIKKRLSQDRRTFIWS